MHQSRACRRAQSAPPGVPEIGAESPGLTAPGGSPSLGRGMRAVGRCAGGALRAAAGAGRGGGTLACVTVALP